MKLNLMSGLFSLTLAILGFQTQASASYVPVLPSAFCPDPLHNMYPVVMPTSSASLTATSIVVRRCALGVPSSIVNFNYVRNITIGEVPVDVLEIATYGTGMEDVLNWSSLPSIPKIKQCKVKSGPNPNVVVVKLPQSNGTFNANVYICAPLKLRLPSKVNGTLLQQRAVIAAKIHREVYLQGQYQADVFNILNTPSLGNGVKVYDYAGIQFLK